MVVAVKNGTCNVWDVLASIRFTRKIELVHYVSSQILRRESKLGDIRRRARIREKARTI